MIGISFPGNRILYLGAGDAFDAEAVGFYRSANAGGSWTAATGMGKRNPSCEGRPSRSCV